MAKLTRFFFLIADLMAIIMLIGAAVGWVQFLFGAVSATFGPVDVGAQVVVASWVMFAVMTVLAAIGCFGCILLLRRQVLGLAIIAGLGVFGLFLTPMQLDLYIYVFGCQLLLLGLPWLLMYYDLKRRGVSIS